MSDFELELNCWLRKNGFVCDVEFDDDFGYNIETNTLYIGTLDYDEVRTWFEQFLYEYGCEYCGFYYPVMCLLHELGHKKTIANFTPTELLFLSVKKEMLDERMKMQEAMFEYWELPDEFAANMWVVDFINSNVEAVEELCGIYLMYWNDFVKEMY